MKDELAMSILADVMSSWDNNRLNDELSDIQVISDLKYDDYQQYTHGKRYIESLALWLRQFKKNKREQAYLFIKEHLLYVSQEEMYQLVECSFDLKMKPYLIDKTRRLCTFNNSQLEDACIIYSIIRRRTLFLGLSDGAHIDYFRRQNPSLSNEQVFIHYDFSNNKATEMKSILKNDLSSYSDNDDYKEDEFLNYFLVDDFSASGKSYIRKENDTWCGKIIKFFDRLKEVGYKCENIDIHLILYVATNKALEYIRSNASLFFEGLNIDFTIDALQIVEPLNCDIHILNMLKENYDDMIERFGKENSFEDVHFAKGEGNEPYLGFAGCSLPLVLYHNTPNNSFPIIWHNWNENVNALFQRVTRHRE